MMAADKLPQLAILSLLLMAAPLLAAASGSSGGGSAGAGGGGHGGGGAAHGGASLGAHGAANSTQSAHAALSSHMAAVHTVASRAPAGTNKKPLIPHPIFNPSHPYRDGDHDYLPASTQSCIPWAGNATAYWSDCDRPSKAGSHP